MDMQKNLSKNDPEEVDATSQKEFAELESPFCSEVSPISRLMAPTQDEFFDELLAQLTQNQEMEEVNVFGMDDLSLEQD